MALFDDDVKPQLAQIISLLESIKAGETTSSPLSAKEQILQEIALQGSQSGQQGTQVTVQDLDTAASQHTRPLLEDAWQVAQTAAGGQNILYVTSQNYTPNVLPSAVNAYKGAQLQFTSGANAGATTTITNIAAVGGQLQVQLGDNLVSTAIQGDTFVVKPSVSLTVTSPDNIAQIGGVAVPTPGSPYSGPVLPMAGNDGTDARAIKTASDGSILPSGTDGTNQHNLITDTLGRLITTATGTLTNRSGTITAGGTSQQLAAANVSRRYLLVQNPSSATESIWINFTASAVASQPSIEITAGGGYVMEAGFVSTEAVNIVAATTGHAFTAKEA